MRVDSNSATVSSRGWWREVQAEIHIVDFFLIFVFNVRAPNTVVFLECAHRTLGESSPQMFPKPHFPDCSSDSGNPRTLRERELDPSQAESQAHTRTDAYTHTGQKAVLPGMEDAGWLDGDLGGCD